MSETRVEIMNCVIFDEMKMKINKTIQTLEDRCTTMETLPEQNLSMELTSSSGAL